MSGRRKLLIALGTEVLVAPLACFAQQQRPSVARIGLLETGSRSASAKWREALTARLRELGLVEGRNIVFEERWVEGGYDRLPAVAAELAQMKVDVLVAATPPAIRAAQRATTSIPIVMVRTSDPVALGFVASLSRPGGNITGVSNLNEDLSSKYLELLRAALPKLSRVAVLVNPGQPLHAAFVKRVHLAAQKMGVNEFTIDATAPSHIDSAFKSTVQERAGALIVLPDPFFLGQAARISELATQHRLPTIFGTREYVESGGLMSYGQNRAEDYYRAATYIDKILKGAKPGELPVEQPTKLELVINRKTAQAIRLTIPQELLLRADKVIE